MNNEKQRKILQIITKSNFGGAQKYVYELSSELKKYDFDVLVAFGGDGILKEKLEKELIRTIQIEQLNRNINLISDIKVFFEIINIIKKERPDIIHLNSSKIGAIGSLAARFCRVPKIIFTVHGLAFNEDRSFISKIIIKKIYWFTIFLSHYSIAVSENVKEQLLSIPFFNILKNKIIVIKNEIKKIDFIEKEESKKFIGNKIGIDISNKKIIGTIAELHHIKGINYLISSAKKVLDKNPNSIFVIFGDGEEKENLQKQIGDLNLRDKFFLIGFVDEASKYLKGLDLFVLPSLSEGLALVILEAKQADLKIAASKVGGIPEAISNYEKNSLFEPKNIAEISESINYLIQKEFENKQKIQENNFNNIVEKTIETYNK